MAKPIRRAFDSPFTLLAAVVECLSHAFAPDEWDRMRIFTGELGTGHTLDCCPDPVLRVEAGPLMSWPQPQWLAAKPGCVDLVQTVVVNYRRCYMSVAPKGNKMLGLDELQQQGQGLLTVRWNVLRALACCDASVIEFVSQEPTEPATCMGFTMTLQGAVRVCDCDSLPSVVESATVPGDGA